MSRRITRVSAALSALAVTAVLSGCGLGTAGGFTPTGQLAGELDSVESLSGAQVKVGSKNFTEALVVGKMAVILLQSAGADVVDLTNIPGSSSGRQALLQGDVTMMYDYTGTAWINYLGNTTPIMGADKADQSHKQWEAVREADLSNGLTWLAPAPMNNSYGFAVKKSVGEELGITKLSQIQDVPQAQRTFCVETEFNNRTDGMDPMLEAYDVPAGSAVPKQNIKVFDTGAIYAATAAGDCTFGEVFTTDGRIKALDLVTLADDRQFFPSYNLVPVLDSELLAEHPQLEELFDKVSAKLTDEVLLDLNAKVDVEGQEPTDVAWDWLVSEGFIEE